MKTPKRVNETKVGKKYKDERAGIDTKKEAHGFKKPLTKSPFIREFKYAQTLRAIGHTSTLLALLRIAMMC